MTFVDLPEPFWGMFESDEDYVPELVLNVQVRSRGFWIISRYLSSWSARNLPISELRFFFSFAIFQNRKNVTSNHNHHNNSWIVILFKQNLFIINQFEITYCFFRQIGRFGSSYAHFGFWVKINSICLSAGQKQINFSEKIKFMPNWYFFNYIISVLCRP